MAESLTGAIRSRRRSREPPPELISPADLRLVLVGKTGSGKSSSGNTILGRDAFRASVSQSSVTKECFKGRGEVFGRDLSIIDTPGLFDTSLPEAKVQREISKCINMSAPGPHAILLVIKVRPFTDEEQNAVKQVEKIFGKDAWRYTIILFTQDDESEPDLEKHLEEAEPELQSVLKRVGHRYHILNNNKTNDRGQVLDLLEKVEKMVAENGGQFYSNPTYLEMENLLNQRESELRHLYQKKLEEAIKAVETKYNKKFIEAQQKHQQVEKRLQSERDELIRYYHALKSNARYVIEQTVPTDSMEDIVSVHKTLKLKCSF